MDTARKPLWPKIVATVVLLPALYVASYGPAMAMIIAGILPECTVSPLVYAHAPLRLALDKAPPAIQRAHAAYWWWWVETGDELASRYLSGL